MRFSSEWCVYLQSELVLPILKWTFKNFEDDKEGTDRPPKGSVSPVPRSIDFALGSNDHFERRLNFYI